jgi:hypothetical protein
VMHARRFPFSACKRDGEEGERSAAEDAARRTATVVWLGSSSAFFFSGSRRWFSRECGGGRWTQLQWVVRVRSVHPSQPKQSNMRRRHAHHEDGPSAQSAGHFVATDSRAHCYNLERMLAHGLARLGPIISVTSS